MSLLTRNAPHVVEVQRQHYVYNEDRMRDELAPYGEPIEVRCAVQDVRDWSSKEEITTNGLQLLAMRMVISREWPGNVDSLVYYEGTEFETIGSPQERKMSPRTRHWTTTLRMVGKDTRPPREPAPEPDEAATS